MCLSFYRHGLGKLAEVHFQLLFGSKIYIFFYVASILYHFPVTQLAITCSKLTIETLEQGVKYVQS